MAERKCARCKEYHQRLIAVDNEYVPQEKICLSCLAELLIGRGQHGDRLIGQSDIKRVLRCGSSDQDE